MPTKISIITPIYNAGKYLNTLYKSVVSQIYTQYEWICIDDGSQDNSLELLKLYQKSNNKIKVIHQENQGVSAARNIGISAAKGEWVCFLDADDEVTPEWLINYINILKEKENTIDIIFQGAIIHDVNSTHKFQMEDTIYPKKDFSVLVNQWQKQQGHIGSAWSKMIRMNLIKNNNIRFNQNINNFEDWIFLIECLAATKNNIVTISPMGYIYNHQNSTLTGDKCKKYDSKKYFEIFKASYQAAHKLEKVDKTSYKIILSKISIIMLQGIKEIYREHLHTSKERIKILKTARLYKLTTKGIGIKNWLIYIILKICPVFIGNHILQILFTYRPTK